MPSKIFPWVSLLVLISAFNSMFAYAADTVTNPLIDNDSLINVKPKIVGGEEVQQIYPWMASLQSLLPNGTYQHFCGGSLIHEKWILTAAHCVLGVNPEQLRVVLGTLNLNNTNNAEIKLVNNIGIHAGYNRNVFLNDIALVELATPSSATPIRLADENMQNQLVENDSLTVSGWGRLSEGGNAPNVLNEVSVPMRTYAQCLQAYPGNLSITSRDTICAGLIQGGQDSCQGDSGGPLFVLQNGVHQQVGIVSWGQGCARPERYGVYTKVSSYRLWIDAIAADIAYDTRRMFGYIGANQTFTYPLRVNNTGNSSSRIISSSIGGTNAGNFSLDSGACSNNIASFSGCSAFLTVSAGGPGSLSAIINTQFQSQTTPSVAFELRMQTLPTIFIGSELDVEGLIWYSGDDAAWQRFLDNTAKNGSALSSGSISDYQSSALVTYLEGPGTFSFKYKVSSEDGYDFLVISHNGKNLGQFSGEIDWQPYQMTLSAGMNQITLAYVKDQSESLGADSAYVDDIVYAPSQQGGGSLPVQGPGSSIPAIENPDSLFPGSGDQTPNNIPLIPGGDNSDVIGTGAAMHPIWLLYMGFILVWMSALRTQSIRCSHKHHPPLPKLPTNNI